MFRAAMARVCVNRRVLRSPRALSLGAEIARRVGSASARARVVAACLGRPL